MSSPIILTGHWHEYTHHLLSAFDGEVTLLLVRLTHQPNDVPILPGQDPDTHRALGIEMSQRLISAGLGPIFLVDTHIVVSSPGEAVALYSQIEDRPCIHIAHLGQAMAFVYPGQATVLINHNRPANQALDTQAPVTQTPTPPASTPPAPAPSVLTLPAPAPASQAPAPRVPAYRPPAIRAQAVQGHAIHGCSAPDLVAGDAGSQVAAVQPTGCGSSSSTIVSQIKRQYDHPVYPKYHGNPMVLENWPKNIPDSENTSIWIDTLPAAVTHHDILSRIRGAGRVKQLHINEPTEEKPTSAAAKVTFFTRRAAAAAIAHARAGRFAVGSVVPRVTWNRWRTAEDPPAGRSRVLVIRGPANIVNRGSLESFWRPHMWWDVDEVVELPAPAQDRAIVHYSFGSWRCQAAVAKRELERAYPNEVTVYYGDDPCGPE